MALTFENELESLNELEFESAGESESELEFEFEGAGELELEGGLEGEINPVRKIYADAMMEHLAHVAAECESEQEAAEQFLPLIGLAAKKLLPVVARALAPAARKALPRIARAVTHVEPKLTRGVTQIARTLYRNPGTRRLLHAVPSIARRTVHTIAGQAAKGQPVTPTAALRTLAHHAKYVLGHRGHRHQALRRSAILDRRFHRHVGPGAIRPHHTHPGVGVPATAQSVRSVPGGCPRCSGAAAAPAYCRCCGQLIR